MMIVRSCFTAVLLFVLQSSFAQLVEPDYFKFEKGDEVYFYFNSDEKVIDNENNATYYRKAAELDDGFWKFTDYFSQSGKVRREGIKKNPNPLFIGDFKGELATFFETGEVEEFEAFDDKGNRIGNYFLNYETGKVKEEGNYEEGKKQGEWKEYYDNGEVKSLKSFEGGKLTGRVEYYYKTGTIKREAEYTVIDKDAVKTGEEISYYENEIIKSQVFFNDGKAQGKHIENHENGEVKVEGQYDDEGNKTGIWKEYYDNGLLRVEKRYDADVLVRQSQSYHKNGKVKVRIETIAGGGFNGPYKRYHDNGEIAEEGEFKEGERIGVFKVYREEDGMLKSAVNHETGEKTFYDKKGKVISAPHRADEIPEKDKKLIKQINKELDIPEKHKTKNRGVYGFTVSKEGEIVKSRVISTADDFVDSAVLAALKNIKLSAAEKNGKPVETENAVVIFFDKDSKNYEMMLGEYYIDEGSDDELFRVVEDSPMFKGGESELFKFLSQNITYPGAAKDEGLSGIVFVNFTVDKSGVLTNPRIVRGVHPALDLAALDAVGKMPAWNAGLQRERPVLVTFNLPIRFTLR